MIGRIPDDAFFIDINKVLLLGFSGLCLSLKT